MLKKSYNNIIKKLFICYICNQIKLIQKSLFNF